MVITSTINELLKINDMNKTRCKVKQFFGTSQAILKNLTNINEFVKNLRYREICYKFNKLIFR